VKQDFDQSTEKTLQYKQISIKKPSLLINKAGLQMLTIFRLIQFLNSINARNPAKILSRAMRFLYGSDIHPLTDIKSGVSFVHRFGIVTSSKTKIKKGSIIFHNVTLGMGRDQNTGAIGSPTIGENVHIGPGASITGPVTIGNNTKISSGVVIQQNIPEGSVILQAKPRTTLKNERKN
jgi:serine O-acetyltransferase